MYGSISGGSALKFGIYQSAENRNWFAGTATAQRLLTMNEASAIAVRQRDQLLAGVQVLTAAARSSAQIDYEDLHTKIFSVAPDVADLAWGHKYFALLFPTVLDDYHSVDYQRYHIVKILQVPSAQRYVNARVLVGAARRLGIPVSTLGTVLNERDGAPREYWRVGTTTDGADEWPRMRDGGFVAIGWSPVGNLSDVQLTQESKDTLRAKVAAQYSSKTASAVTESAGQQLFNFNAEGFIRRGRRSRHGPA